MCCCPILFALLPHVRGSSFLYKQPGYGCKGKAQHDSADRRHQEGHNRPLKTARFLSDSKKGGGAGPVHQGEKHGTDSGNPGPAVIYQQFPKLCQAVKFQKASLGHVGMIMMGITISLAGSPRINAIRITPSIPRSLAKGSRKPEQWANRVMPFTCTFAMTQIKRPAGAATAMALPSTNRVRSKMERTITLPIWGRR